MLSMSISRQADLCMTTFLYSLSYYLSYLRTVFIYLFFSYISVRETGGTHETAEAQQVRNNDLRRALGIPENFVDGSSFDPERKLVAKEKAAAASAAKSAEMLQRKYAYAISIYLLLIFSPMFYSVNYFLGCFLLSVWWLNPRLQSPHLLLQSLQFRLQLLRLRHLHLHCLSL